LRKLTTDVCDPTQKKSVVRLGSIFIPYAIVYSKIATLPFVAGKDPMSTAHLAIDIAAAKWSSVTQSYGLTHDDTITSIYDNTIGAEDLPARFATEVHWVRHCTFWFIICWSYDSHLVKTVMNINNDANDFRWDYLADNPNTTPMTVDVLKVVLHEFGHWVLLCDTYPDAPQAGNCTGVVREDTVMTYYHFGNGYRDLFTHDMESLRAVYGG
jgi:hypothetical protein